MKTTDYLDAIKAKYEVSDYKLAPLLGIGKAAVSGYRNRGTEFDDTVAIRAARLLNLPEDEVLANIHAARAKDDDVRKVWERLAEKLHGAAASVMIAVIMSVALLAPIGDKSNAYASNSDVKEHSYIYYVKLLIALFFRPSMHSDPDALLA